MGKIVYAMNISLDGFIESLDGKLDWSIPDEELHRHYNNLEKDVELHLYGRKMYQIMNFWRNAEKNLTLSDYEREFAQHWNFKHNIIFSQTLKKVELGDVLVRNIIVEDIQKLKTQSGKYIDVGGSELATKFLELGLVDEIRFYFVPILLGGGKPMFHLLKHTISLKLEETKTFRSGVVLLRYRCLPKSNN